jgi:hypothetical protein
MATSATTGAKDWLAKTLQTLPDAFIFTNPSACSGIWWCFGLEDAAKIILTLEHPLPQVIILRLVVGNVAYECRPQW